MNALSNSETKTEFSLHPATKIGTVSLKVADLENQLTFYQQALGFQLHWREGTRAGLGASVHPATGGGSAPLTE
jgi:catechol-2,3-dioxygenase